MTTEDDQTSVEVEGIRAECRLLYLRHAVGAQARTSITIDAP
jgi:hypothetical protein